MENYTDSYVDYIIELINVHEQKEGAKALLQAKSVITASAKEKGIKSSRFTHK